MLVSCSPDHADSANTDVESSNKEIPKISIENSYLDIEIDRQNSTWKVDVYIKNDYTSYVCIDPNFQSTSKLIFFDASGKSIDSYGFEGRPSADCRESRSGSVEKASYSNEQFPSLDFESVKRICYMSYWREDNQGTLNPIEICGDR
jgi:hypothetical protein